MTRKKEQTQPGLLKQIKPKTKNQHEYIRGIAENQIVLAVGPAGSGKTCLATGIGCEYLYNGKVDKLILTRPVIESGRGIGYLKGDVQSKTHEFMIPILDELNNYLGPVVTQRLLKEEKIQIAPLCFIRGRTFNNAYCICDEMQNATREELKLLLTRIGSNSKMIINGDLKQSDLPQNQQGALEHCINVLGGLEDIAIIKLYDIDIVRNPLISKILERLK